MRICVAIEIPARSIGAFQLTNGATQPLPGLRVGGRRGLRHGCPHPPPTPVQHRRHQDRLLGPGAARRRQFGRQVEHFGDGRARQVIEARLEVAAALGEIARGEFARSFETALRQDRRRAGIRFGHALGDEEPLDAGLVEGSEADLLAAGADRRQQDGCVRRDEHQGGAAGRLLEGLEQRVLRVDRHALGIVDDADLARTPHRPKPEVAAHAPHLFDRHLRRTGPLGLRALEVLDEEVGMRPRLDESALSTRAATRARLALAEAGPGECEGGRALPDAGRTGEDVSVREAVSCQRPAQQVDRAILADDVVEPHRRASLSLATVAISRASSSTGREASRSTTRPREAAAIVRNPSRTRR